MKRMITANEDAASSFDTWYDSLSSKEQDSVDSLADEMGLPVYSECTEGELSTLHDSFTSSNVTASTDIDTHLSACSFDFDLGNVYDGIYLDRKICDIFDAMGLYCKGVDFRAVKYPKDKLYSQCQVDFEWSGSYDDKAIEDALEALIDDEGGNFFGIDFYSLDPEESITASVSVNQIKDWYGSDTEIDPKRLEQSLNIQWDITIEDIECLLKDPIDLSNIKSVKYMSEEQEDKAREEGYDGGYIVKYNDGTVKAFAFKPYPYELDPVTEVSITASVNPWKVKYEVHWISPDGKDCLLGGANDIDEVNAMAINQANELFDSPFETDERKLKFLTELYIVDTATGDDAMLTSTEDYIDDLIRRIRKEV